MPSNSRAAALPAVSIEKDLNDAIQRGDLREVRKLLDKPSIRVLPQHLNTAHDQLEKETKQEAAYKQITEILVGQSLPEHIWRAYDPLRVEVSAIAKELDDFGASPGPTNDLERATYSKRLDEYKKRADSILNNLIYKMPKEHQKFRDAIEEFIGFDLSKKIDDIRNKLIPKRPRSQDEIEKAKRDRVDREAEEAAYTRLVAKRKEYTGYQDRLRELWLESKKWGPSQYTAKSKELNDLVALIDAHWPSRNDVDTVSSTDHHTVAMFFGFFANGREIQEKDIRERLKALRLQQGT
jgi:hypothetical protein